MPSAKAKKKEPKRSPSDRTAENGDKKNADDPRKIVIKPIKTTDDIGEPGISVADDLQRVLDLVDDERHLVAHDLYEDVKARMEEIDKHMSQNTPEQIKKTPQKKPKPGKQQRTKQGWLSGGKARTAKATAYDEQEFKRAKEILKKHQVSLDLLDKRAPLFLKAKHDMDDSENWTLAQTLFGITTYYRREDDDSLSIKLEGDLKGIPLFEQVAVLREIDLHSSWAPFVTSSLTLAQLDKLDTIGWIMVGLPNFGLARDACFRCIGCDCTKEDNSILIYGQGVCDRPEGVLPERGTEFLADDPVLETIGIPSIPTRMGSGRMTIRNFEARCTVLAPDHCRTYVLANVNPNLAFMPQSLIEFVMKKLCGFLLNKLQSAAKKTVKNPIKNIHAQRMREDSAFYYDWLLPKFEAVARDMGWEVPTISAFELTEAQQVEAARLRERRATRMHSFSHFEASKARLDSEGADSSRSAPVLSRRPSSFGSDSDPDDSSSEISSLSGTSSSIWKNNPIAAYLREMEMKTQERKKQAVLESRQKAAARLQPRPFPQDKAERLKILKMHKARKLRARSSSGASFDGSFGSFGSGGLARVDEHDSVTDGTERSEPYSPISAALQDRGRWTRLMAISVLVMLLFLLLHVNEMVPSFTDRSDVWWVPYIRELTAVVYMVLCGAVHFLLCDVELIYAFEAFELGMKSGEQVKTFYRGQTRLAVAAVSATLVAASIVKAVALAMFKTIVFSVARYYNSLGDDSGSNNVIESIASVIEDEEARKGVAAEFTATEEQIFASSLPGFVFGACSTFFNLLNAVFEWQMNVFVRSNPIGRSMEHLSTGIYGMWMGFLGNVARKSGNFFHSMTQCENIRECLSWRDDAFATLRVLLLYTAVFLLAILAMLDIMAKSYRHRKPGATKTEKETPDSASVTDAGSSTPLRMPLKNAVPSSSISSADSSKKRRLRFRRKRKESQEDREDSD